MPTLAFSAYGTEMRLSDGVPLAALTLTNATNTSPITITTSAPHGIIDVSHGTITGVVGNLGANGDWVLERVTATTLRLRKSIGTGTYTSGGSLVIDGTFATIAELRDVQNAGSQADLIDVSAHDGDMYSSEIVSLKRTNHVTLEINLVPANPTHNPTTGLLALFNSGARRDWLLVLPPYKGTGVKAAGHVFGTCTYYTLGALQPSGAVQASVELAFDGRLTWTP